MIVLGAFAVLRPWWLLALPLAGVLTLLARGQTAGLGDWQRAIDPHLLAALRARGAATGGSGGTLRAAIAAILVVIVALSGPALRRSQGGGLRNLDATLIVMDLSNDATSGLLLRRAQGAAQMLLQRAGARQLGLILFAGDAYLAAPLTDDAAATGALLFALDAQTVPDPGNRPARALALARKVLREADIIAGDVVLVSSGAGLDAATTREAAGLKSDGHALHALYLRHDEATELPDSIRRSGMAALAAAGGGISADVAGPEPVLAEISGRALQHVGAGRLGISGWLDMGRWLLLAALAPLLLMFRRAAA